MDNENKAVFTADRVTIAGPKVDGGYKVSFEIGEYQFDNIKNLPKLNGRELVVAVLPGEDLKKKGMNPPEDESGWGD